MPALSGNLGVRCITDIRKGLGPVGGLHAGALAARGDVVFVSACDMPCVNPAVVARLFDEIDGYDAVIPQWNPEMLEPLHAVYRRLSLLSYLESHDSLSLRFMIKTFTYPVCSDCRIPPSGPRTGDIYQHQQDRRTGTDEDAGIRRTNKLAVGSYAGMTFFKGSIPPGS